MASWLALSHGSEVTWTDWKVKICHKNVAMSAAHETLTLEPGEREGTGVPGFGGLTVSDHSAHQLRWESRWCLRGWCRHLDGSTSQAAHHTSARVLAPSAIWENSARVSSFRPRAPSCCQSGRNGPKATATTFRGGEPVAPVV